MNKIIKKISFVILLTLFFINNSFSFDIKARTAILQDFSSGKILFEKEPDREIYPASMTKIMTSIIAFDLLKNGELNLDDTFVVSEKAWKLSTAGYSSMFIMVGDNVSVEDLLKGIIVASGNDACVALAEGIAGTEEQFAILMTEKAFEIGMTNTNFSNASGINDPDNYSTVKDILIMSNYLIKNFPDYYTYFKETDFTWDRTGGDPITQGNRNPLLYKNIGADGIKTGYLAVERYSLASSVKKNERRLIAVASGFNTKNDRSRQSIKLLTWGLTNFDLVKVSSKNKSLAKLDVWLGKDPFVDVYTKDDVFQTIKKARKKNMKILIDYDGPIKAPIEKNQELGKLKIYFKDEILSTHNVYALTEVKKVNLFTRILKSLNYLVWGDV
ncbi:D-alanyl-D-alanine carboxypeptidase [Pelagibacterales bacterium SAG-MED15]|nr:D-alanyl-D-alanine carboxypeptidase [Pelagibacterales bacterium SAG-MED15]